MRASDASTAEGGADARRRHHASSAVQLPHTGGPDTAGASAAQASGSGGWPLECAAWRIGSTVCQRGPTFDSARASAAGESHQALYSIRSERQLVQHIEYNLLYRGFVGLDMDDAVWDPSSFTQNRDRLLDEALARSFFGKVLNWRSGKAWSPRSTMRGRNSRFRPCSGRIAVSVFGSTALASVAR